MYCLGSVQSKRLMQNQKIRSKTRRNYCLFRFALVRSEKVESKRSEKIQNSKQNQAKLPRGLFCFSLKQKIWSEMKRKMRNFSIFLKAKDTKHMHNRSCFASFRFTAKIFEKRNRRTLGIEIWCWEDACVNKIKVSCYMLFIIFP